MSASGIANHVDYYSCGARVFYRLVRDFSLSVAPWDPAAVYHEVMPDERWDLTLVSRRVYGQPDEYLAVMAAAGLDSVDQPLDALRLTLPSPGKLREFKRAARFESRAANREAGKPTWAAD
jgi:hypothetical protein